MATIATRVFGDGTSTLFTLYNEEYVRTLGFANGWTRLRIGILFAVQASGNFTISTNCGIGVCTGNATIANTQGIKSSTCTNWVGATWCNLAYGSTSMTYAAGPPAYVSGNIMNLIAKRGNSVIAQNGNGTPWYMPVAGSGNRGFMFVDIIKISSANTQVYPYIPTTSANAQINFTMDDLLLISEQVRDKQAIFHGLTILNHPVGAGLGTDENAGPFDTLSLYWPNASTPLEVYGIVISSTF